MIGVENQEVERKTLSILRILSETREPVGARVIARRLEDLGIGLTERAVRYHLKLGRVNTNSSVCGIVSVWR